MSPELLPAISAFTCVARHASFTRAAAELGVSPSALSQTVKTLERRLGVRLLDRTTRRVGVTEIGQRFLVDAQAGLATINAALAGLDEARAEPAGLLRLNVSRAAADILLLPHLGDFMSAYPAITLDIVCDNGLVDLVAGKFDAGIRLGELLAQDMVSVPLGGAQRLATFASPGYLQAHGAPQAPADLHGHRCLNARLPSSGTTYRWEYMQPQAPGELFDIEIALTLLCNDGDFLTAAARSGAGIGCAFEALVQEDFRAGRLLPLLQPWWPRFTGFHLYHASRHQMPRKLRVFIDFLQPRLAG